MKNLSSPEFGDMRSRLIVIITLITAVIVGVIFALSQLYRPRPAEAIQVKAVTASPPLIYLAGPILDNSLAGSDGSDPVKSLIPPKANLHNYSPSPSDIEKALTAEVFFSLSDELLPLEELFLRGHSSENRPTIISAAKAVSLIHLDEDEDAHDHEDSGSEIDHDIHIWMSPRQAMEIVKHFETALSELYPDNSIYYRARGGEFRARLRDLDENFAHTLSNCEKDIIVVSHNAFAYLARDYGFEVWALHNLGLEAGISPNRLIEATEKIKVANIDHLFYTSEASPRILKTITDELGTTLLPLHTLENSIPENLTEREISISDAYIAVMEANLQLLSRGLGCSD